MSEKPKYLQVADILRREIAGGAFRDGDTLTTEEELRLRFRVSRQTVRQAISLLEEDGLVDRRRGSGTYVRHGPRKRQGLPQIAVLMGYLTDYISPAIISGIESVITEYGAVMTLGATRNDPGLERALLERMMDGQVDGLIAEGCRSGEQTMNADCYRRFLERNIPVVFLNSYFRELPEIPRVAMDDYAGGRHAAEEMYRRGYRRPAAIFKTDDLQGQERERGFREGFAAFGVSLQEENCLNFGTEERMILFSMARGKSFMDRLARLEADSLICYNDVIAMYAMEELRQRGVRLPEDLGVMGFDNAPLSSMTRPPLTTLGHPQEKFGALAAEKLLRMMEGEPEQGEELPWILVERDSLPTRTKP